MTAVLANHRNVDHCQDFRHHKVATLEMALDRLPAGRADRALMLATLCSELTIGSPLEPGGPWPKRLWPSRSWGDDAVIVRVLNHVLLPLRVPSMLEESAGPDSRRAGPSGASR